MKSLGGILKASFRRPLGALSGGLLIALYPTAVFADLIRYRPPPMCRTLDRTYHPPTKIIWGEGGLRAQAYANRSF